MTSKLRVIFLDVDGVLNNEKSFEGNNLDVIDYESLMLLNELINSTDACIVISSSWRIGHTLHWLQNWLQGEGFNFPEKIIGATISDTKGGRGQEIQTWLQQVPVDSFVIFDDDGNMGPVNSRLIQTTFKTGLQREHIELAKKMLCS